jgi:ribonucleoside-diphosphate reductase alpha chain
MKVIKRDGAEESVKLEKIVSRIKKQTYDLNRDFVEPMTVAQKVIAGIYDGITTKELDRLAAETAAAMTVIHPDYSILAGRIEISSLKKETSKNFSEVIETLYNYVNPKTNEKAGMISDELYTVVKNNAKKFDSMIVHDRDFNYEYFGYRTLERSYLLKINGKVVETPQHMLMRVAVALWGDNFTQVQKSYDLFSTKQFTHATPTLFNAGTKRPQLSSCFLIANKGDDIENLFETIGDVAKISKWAGGVGLHIHDVRAKGSYIKGTGGLSDGLVPMLKTYNDVARWINQCFTPETIIYTNNGVKKIENLTTSDLILTKDGKYCEIGEIFVYEQKGGVIEIETKSSIKPLRVTDAHPIYSFKNTFSRIGRSNKEFINQLEKGIITPEWIDSGQLNVGDFIGKAIPKEIVDITHFSKDDAFIYGLLLGDGHISDSEAGISFNHNTNISEIDIVREYLKLKSINFWEVYKDNCLQIRFSVSNLKWLNYDLLYNDNSKKRIHKSLRHLPLDKSINIIKGLIKSDGGVYRGNEIHFYNTSEMLIEDLSYQILRFGAPSYGSWVERENNSQYLKEHGCKKETSISCDLRIPNFKELADALNIKEVERKNWIVWDGILYTRITSINKLDDYNGLVYDLKVKHEYDDASYTLSNGLVHNGGKRLGSFAIYLEPWHADIFDFIDLRKNHGKEEMRARDLFLALWIPDLFMQRVEEDGNWTLMCPNECPGLSDVYDSKDSKAFTELYTSYENANKGRKTIKARDLWGKVLEAQIETGAPYVLYKDSANNKSNQKNIGVIKSSNLCTEIMEVSTPDEQAVCNLASVSLPAMVDNEKKIKSFNHQKLYDVVYQMTHNLNRVIDINYYPTKETKKSNLRHRPIGLGVQGLADVFQMLGLAFESPEAMKLNQDIFETMYFASLTASKDIARAIRREIIKAEESSTKEGDTPKEVPYTAGAYETFVGSPLSKGILQFDMWETSEKDFSGRWDWDKLKKDIIKYGVRNSLLMAPMPTASTAQILGNNECFEPYTSNIYKRNTLSGEFVVVNKHLINDLISLNLWNDKMRVKILENNGSIQTIEEIPLKTREIYKTVWEMKLSNLMDMSRDRGIFICQSQSFNIFMPDVNVGKLNKALFYAWKMGLKTGMYYLRTKSKAQARQNLGIDTQIIEEVKIPTENVNANDAISCSIDNPEDCQMCSG